MQVCREVNLTSFLLPDGVNGSALMAWPDLQRAGASGSEPDPVLPLPFGKVLVAIANKHARQIWAMLAHGVDYDSHACLAHPMHRQAA
mgnify:CR=1 FL=1